MILKIGRFLTASLERSYFLSSRTSRLVQQIYATLLLRSLSLLFCGPCSLLTAVEAVEAMTAGAEGVSSSEAEAASSGLKCDDLCSGVGTCTEHFSYICVRDARS